MTEEFVKPHIILVSHGQLCVGIKDSARMIGASMDNITAIPLLEGVAPQDYEAELRKALDAAPEGSIVLADLFGGTPFNTMAKILVDYPGIYSVTGLNLPMLLEVAGASNFMSGEALLNSALTAGREGVTNVNEFVANLLAESQKSNADDEEDI